MDMGGGRYYDLGVVLLCALTAATPLRACGTAFPSQGSTWDAARGGGGGGLRTMPRIARMSAPDRRWPMSPHVHIDDGSPPPPGSAGPAGGPEACTPVQITDNVVRAVDPGPQPSPRAVLVKEAPHATGPRPSILKQGQAPPRQRHSVGSSQAKSEGYSFGSAAPSDGGGGTRDSFHRRISRMSHSSMRVLRRKTWHNMSGDNLRWYEFVVIISLSVSLAVMAGLINAVSLLRSAVLCCGRALLSRRNLWFQIFLDTEHPPTPTPRYQRHSWGLADVYRGRHCRDAGGV